MRNQILHILRKDIRRHWREIALSFAIVVAYAWRNATRPVTSVYAMGGLFFQSQLLSLLVLVAWSFLILRAVHAECLVGDRQFWVTRPYKWKQLLVAKLLFVLLFVNLPLLLLQAFLLLAAGYSPTAHFFELLSLQLEWAAILVLPAATLATVTAGIGQFVLACLALLLYFMAMVATLPWLVPAAEVSGASTVPGGVAVLAAVGAALAAILWQYARRRTARSRILLLGAAAVVPAILLAAPYRFLIRRVYPSAAPGQPLPVQLAFDPAKPASLARGFPEKNRVHVEIPLLVSGLADRSMVRLAGTNVTIQGPGGQHWSSGWRRDGGILLPEHRHYLARVTIDRDFFERVKSVPVNVDITFALAPARATEAIRVVARTAPFALPGEGRCSLASIGLEGMECIFPLKIPFLLMSVKSDEVTCAPGRGEAPLPPGTIGYAWIWGLIPGGAEPAISPVHDYPVSFWTQGQVKPRSLQVCPGTPLTVLANWEDLQRARMHVQIHGIRLVDYKLNDASDGWDVISTWAP
jgi:hypothetical protein